MALLDSTRLPVVYAVDDEDANLYILKATLKPQNYDVVTFKSGVEMLADLEESERRPDLLLLDIMMPEMDGFEVCRRLRAMPEYSRLPIIMVTGLDDVKHRVEGLEIGADDYLTKPFHPMEARARVKSMLRIKTLGDQLEGKNTLLSDEKLHLEQLVRERTVEMENLTIGVVAALEKANELNDPDTGNHIMRVSGYSELLARKLGQSPMFVNKIRRYASLHDVGKVGVSDDLLKKPGPLTAEEFEEMKLHTVLGCELLELARSDPMAKNIALSHHEKFNGKGYPNGLSGHDIPMEARIVAVADVFDALVTKRCYKNAYPLQMARDIIEEERGRHFDPEVVDAHINSWDEVLGILQQYTDSSMESLT
jgi:putative two-component system response regulator